MERLTINLVGFFNRNLNINLKKSPPVAHHRPYFTVKHNDKKFPETKEETTDSGYRET